MWVESLGVLGSCGAEGVVQFPGNPSPCPLGLLTPCVGAAETKH